MKFKTILPDTKKFKLKFLDWIDQATASQTKVTYDYSGNEIYEVNGSANVQPPGFDLLAQQYTKFMVTSSKIKVTRYSIGSSNTSTNQISYPVEFFIYPSRFSTLSPYTTMVDNYNIIASIPYVRHRTLGVTNDRPQSLTHFMSTKKMFGLNSNLNLGESQPTSGPYWHLSNSAPPNTNRWFWCFGIVAPISQGTTGNIPAGNYKVEITFYGIASGSLAQIDIP